MEAAIGAEGDRDLELDIVEVGHEEIAVAVERQTGIATGVSQVVVVPDQLRGPGRAAVEAHALEQPRRRMVHVRDDHDVFRIGWVNRHRLLGLVAWPLADVDVRRPRGEPQSTAGSSGTDRSDHKRDDDEKSYQNRADQFVQIDLYCRVRFSHIHLLRLYFYLAHVPKEPRVQVTPSGPIEKRMGLA